MADLSDAPAPRRRVELSPDALSRCLAVLAAGAVVDITDPVRARAWHARERAALLARIWGVLRAGEVVELVSDLEITSYGLRVRLQQPKTSRCRWVRLPARGDQFCPVAALEEWLSAASAAGYDLEGRLLPIVLQHRWNGSILGTERQTERNNLLAIVQAAGLEEEWGVNDDDALFGLHNFRSILPTLAADAGHDLPFLQALAAWRRGATPALHYVAARDGAEEARMMADQRESA